MEEKLYRDDLEASKRAFAKTTAYYHNVKRDITQDIFDNPEERVKIGGGTLMLDLNDSDSVDSSDEFVKILELMILDSNNDGIIDSGDRLFGKLKVVMDDGTSYMQRFNYTEHKFNLTREYMLTDNHTTYDPLESHLKSRLDEIYSEYHKELDKQSAKNSFLSELKGGGVPSYSNVTLKNLEYEFEGLTGTQFSVENLERAKMLSSDGVASTFKDQDFVVAMKATKDGYLLRFNTDREIEVDNLYIGSGGFKSQDGFDRVSLPLEKNEILANKADDIDNLAIVANDKLTLLKDAGVKAVSIQRFKNDIILAFLEFEDGDKKPAENIYKVVRKVERESDLVKLQSHPYKKEAEYKNRMERFI